MFSKNQLFIVPAVVLCLGANSVNAETLRFEFTGKVTDGAAMGVPPGTKVVGTFSYDPDTSSGVESKNYAFYQFEGPSVMTATFGTHQVIANTLDVTLMNNTKSNVADLVDVNGMAPILDGTTLASGVIGFRIASAYDNEKALKDTKLPKRFNLDKFNGGPGFNYGYLQADGSATGTLIGFSMDSIEVSRHRK